MIFGKYINRYYLKHAPVLLLGLAALLTVDYIQLLIPQLYRLVINGVNLGQVVVNGETLLFTKEVLLQHICLPMIWIVVLMVIGRFLWRICFFGSAVRVAADLRERMFDHSRRLSQQYYQVNKVGNLMSLYTNDLDTIQECFGDGILMFFDAAVLGIMALVKMWRMDCKLTLLALIPAAVMFAIGTVMSQVMTKRWEERQQAFQHFFNNRFHLSLLSFCSYHRYRSSQRVLFLAAARHAAACIFLFFLPVQVGLQIHELHCVFGACRGQIGAHAGRRAEVDAHCPYLLCRTVLLRFRALGTRREAEHPEIADVHRMSVVQVLAHALHEVGNHAENITFGERTVLFHLVRNLVDAHALSQGEQLRIILRRCRLVRHILTQCFFKYNSHTLVSFLLF